MTQISPEIFTPSIGFQTQGGPEWKTSILPLASGCEVRNSNWARPLRSWSVTGVPLNRTDAELLVRFFNARSGAFEGFLFSDPFGDATAGTVTPLDQQIGVGDGTTQDFQLVLDDGASQLRQITRPVAASLRIAVDEAESTAFSVDETTGIVSFASPPPDGALISAGFQFHTAVRFDQDKLELARSNNGAFQLVRVSLVEVREAING